MDWAGIGYSILDWLIPIVNEIIFWVSKIGPFLLVVGVIIGLRNKINKFLKKLKMTKEEVWQEEQIKKIRELVNANEFLGILLLLKDLLKVFPAEDLLGLLLTLQSDYKLKQNMNEFVVDLKHLLSFEKAVISKPLNEILEEYRQRRMIAEVKNKKLWERLSSNKNAIKAAGNILDCFQNMTRRAAQEARRKGRVNEIEAEIKAIKSEENIIKNREMRHFIETINEKREEKRKKKAKDTMMKELRALFETG